MKEKEREIVEMKKKEEILLVNYVGREEKKSMNRVRIYFLVLLISSFIRLIFYFWSAKLREKKRNEGQENVFITAVQLRKHDFFLLLRAFSMFPLFLL